MEEAVILQLYDAYARRRASFPGMRREEAGPVVRLVMEAEGEGQSYIAYSDLSEANADAVIGREVRYFQDLGRAFEWPVYTHDRPPDLGQRLSAHGFQPDEREAVLVLDLQDAPQQLLQPNHDDIRQVSEPADLEQVRRLLQLVWHEEFAWFPPRMERLLDAGHVKIYVAYVAGEPASAAWIFLPPGNLFAGLYGGSTLPAFRKRGLYSALLAARAQEALRRDYRFLTIDAGDMSRPIVERFGFRLLAMATPYLKQP